MRSSVTPWTVGFVGAIALFGVSIVYLAFVLSDVTSGDGSAMPPITGGETPGPGATTPVDESVEILFEGDAPGALLLPNMRAAAAGEEPDLRFSAASGDDGIAVGYYVPVVAQWTAIEALTGEELRSLLAGDVTNWSQVGGLDVPVSYFEVEGNAGTAIAQSVAPGAVPDQTFASYEALMAAITPDSGAIAFIPLDLLNVSVSAVGVDGVDIARGYGDTDTWPFVERTAVEALTGDGEDALAAIEGTALEAPAVTRVMATGDYLPVRCSLARIEAGPGWEGLFATELGDYLREADLLLSNQDGSIHDIGEHFRCTDTVNLSSPPGAIDGLLAMGVDGVNVATNHIFDCGMEGFCGSAAFERTLELLHEAGIQTAGGGMNLEEALEPAIFEVNGMTFGMLGFDDIAAGNPTWLAAEEDSPGIAPMDDDYDDEYAWNPDAAAFYAPADLLHLERMTATIQSVAEQVDFLVVLFNSGTEDTHNPSERSIKGLRAAVDAGADLVIGNQAHHVQAAEVKDEVFVAYALGNFVYDQVHTVEHTQCYIAEASFWEDRLAAMRLVPCQIQDMHQPRFVDDATRLKILGDVYGAAALLPPE